MRDQRGSVSVEFAAVLPLLAVAMLLVAQIGLVVAQQLTVQHAAREAARAAAVTNDDEQARAVALSSANLDPARASVTIEPSERAVGEPVEVTVRYRPGLMPLVGRFVPSGFELVARVAMRTEAEPREPEP